VSEVLREVRRAKSSAKLSMRAEVARLSVAGASVALVRPAQDDLCAAGSVEEFVLGPEDGELRVEVTLREATPA
jgi:valyl-tRNA synthetase